MFKNNSSLEGANQDNVGRLYLDTNYAQSTLIHNWEVLKLLFKDLKYIHDHGQSFPFTKEN